MGAHENPGPMAYENPMTGAEFIVVGITGVFGFGLGSLADCFLATHAQTDTKKTSTGGYEIYTDAPPAGALYNSEAPLAPMNLMRWGVGLGVPIVLGVGLHFIGGPWAKTVMQGAAVGWGLRTVGKGLDDMLGSLLKKTGLGQRLYGIRDHDSRTRLRRLLRFRRTPHPRRRRLRASFPRCRRRVLAARWGFRASATSASGAARAARTIRRCKRLRPTPRFRLLRSIRGDSP